MDGLGTTDLLIAVYRALGLLFVLVVLYPPLAWFERWYNLPIGEREKLGQHITLPIATVIKLLSKRASVPAHADKPLHIIAPFFALFPALFVLALIPPGPPVFFEEREIHLAVAGDAGSLPALFALLLMSPIGILLASKAGGVHFGLVTGIRMTLVRASGVLVILFANIDLYVSDKSLSLYRLVVAQADPFFYGFPSWGFIRYPVSFFCVILVVAYIGQRTQRTRPGDPGDLLEPYIISSAGPILLAHRVFEVLETMAYSACITALFFGGWLIPGVDVSSEQGGYTDSAVVARVLCYATKTLLVAVGLMSLRRALPKLQFDQIIRVFWFILFPIALASTLLTSIFSSISLL